MPDKETLLQPQKMDSRADRINRACELLNQSLHLCEEGQLQQLEKKISESARMVREAVSTIIDREFSEQETQMVKIYLDLSHRLSGMIRVRRSSTRDEYLRITNTDKIKSIYSTDQ